MKAIIVVLTLLISTPSFSANHCTSDKMLERRATITKMFSAVGIGESLCEKLQIIVQSNLCEDVRPSTLDYATEVLDLCD